MLLLLLLAIVKGSEVAVIIGGHPEDKLEIFYDTDKTCTELVGIHGFPGSSGLIRAAGVFLPDPGLGLFICGGVEEPAPTPAGCWVYMINYGSPSWSRVAYSDPQLAEHGVEDTALAAGLDTGWYQVCHFLLFRLSRMTEILLSWLECGDEL